jgi:hypothetical protein
MIKSWTKTKKIQFIIAQAVLIFMMFSLSFVSVFAAVVFTQQIDSGESIETGNTLCFKLPTLTGELIDSIAVREFYSTINVARFETGILTQLDTDILPSETCATPNVNNRLDAVNTIFLATTQPSIGFTETIFAVDSAPPVEIVAGKFYYFAFAAAGSRKILGSETQVNDFKTTFYSSAANGTLGTPYFRLTSTIAPPPPAQSTIQTLDFQTRFTDASVTGASSSVTFNIDYFLNTPEYTPTSRPDIIAVTISGDTDQDFQQRLITPLITGTSTKSIVSQLVHADGRYSAGIYFKNLNTNDITFRQTGISIVYTVNGGVVDTFFIESISDGRTISTDIIYQDCSITNIYGCFVNALTFVFVPTDGIFNKFTTLYDQIDTKPPFGYVTSILDALGGVSTNAAPAFTFGNIPFVNAIFDPLKLLLAIGLWAIYAMFFMGRLSRIDI